MLEGMQKVEVLRAACCVGGADGKTSEVEAEVLQKLAVEAGVGAASLAAMVERAETNKTFYKEQFRVLKADPQQTMQLLFRLAIKDGKLRKSEAITLKRLAARLGVTRRRFDHWLKQTLEYLQSRKTATDSDKDL